MDAKDRRNREARKRPIKRREQPKPKPVPILVRVDEQAGIIEVKSPRGAAELRVVYERTKSKEQGSALPALWRTLARDHRAERKVLRYHPSQEWLQHRRAVFAALRTACYVRRRLGLPVRGEQWTRWMGIVLELSRETGMHPRDVADQLAEVRDEVAERVEQELLDSGDWIIVN